ncbi:nicotinate-nucleotide adenylyltransferase [[Mycoplasma] testudinis]|uniref:nicotinate-nucleotide adenylyltransferase n=1 Tax=[Mycoplasma] testudinis TaxID=33924 RepID=UPI000489B0F4|nr:nicotinate-nucleotide adenylyltransferase [[Mycoplasma] testudinis]
MQKYNKKKNVIPKKIVLYGGSFDPFHAGHLKSAQMALKAINADVLYLIVSHLSPFKKRINASNYHRIQMIKIATKQFSKIKISLDEIKNKNSYFYKTLKAFKKRFKNDQLFSLIGSDHLSTFDKWENAEWISKNSQIIYLDRPGFPVVHENVKKFKMQRIGETLIDISSSTLRRKSIKKWMNPLVIKYINDNCVYANKRIQERLSNERWQHCLRTARFAKRLARSCNYKNPNEAYVAGLFHDLAKELSKDDLLKYASLLNIKKFTSIKTLHPFAAYYIMKHDYLFDNETILNAVYRHTEPIQKKLTVLDKIIYVADKIEPGRKKDKERQLFDINIMQKLALKNVNQAFKKIYKITLDFFLKKTKIKYN